MLKRSCWVARQPDVYVAPDSELFILYIIREAYLGHQVDLPVKFPTLLCMGSLKV